MAYQPQKPKELVVAQFPKGLNTCDDLYLAKPHEAIAVRNVDLSEGTVQGLYKPEPYEYDIDTGTNPTFVHRLGTPLGDPPFWLYGGWDGTFSALDDADNVGSEGNPDVWLTYFTGDTYIWEQEAGTPTPGGTLYPTPHMAFFRGGSLERQRLGIASPPVAPTKNGVPTLGTVDKSYAYCWYDIYTGEYSNPSETLTVTNFAFPLDLNGGTWNSVNQGDDYRDSANIEKHWFATADDDPLGPMYLIAEQIAGVTAFQDPGGQDFDNLPEMTWGPGGNPSSETNIIEDHTPAPPLDLLSDGMHALQGTGSGQTGAGILVGAKDNVVHISQAGAPWYWPAFTKFPLRHIVSAIVNRDAETYVLTEGGNFVMSGLDEWSMSLARTGSTHFCRRDNGRTAKRTPLGVLYLCDDGIAAFDGQTSRIISNGCFKPQEMELGRVRGACAVYVDDCYIITIPRFWPTDSASSRTFVFDLRRGDVRVTECSFHLSAVCQAPDMLTYVADESGALSIWSPNQAVLEGMNGRYDDWYYQTPMLMFDDPTHLENYDLLWVNCWGSVKAELYAINSAGTAPETSPYFTHTFTGPGHVKLPAMHMRGVSIKFSGVVGTTSGLRAWRLRGETKGGP
jgi:hypothetical protein